MVAGKCGNNESADLIYLRAERMAVFWAFSYLFYLTSE